MKIHLLLIITFFLSVMLFNQACKKTEEKEFFPCGDCNNTEISGTYFGSGKYFTDDDPLMTETVDVELNLENTDTDFFNINIEVP